MIISVMDFGAKGDGEHDDLSAVIAAMNAARRSDTVIMPPGKYRLKEDPRGDG